MDQPTSSYAACRCSGQEGQKHVDDQLATTPDTHPFIKAVEVGVDRVGRETQLLSDRWFVVPVEYALDDLKLPDGQIK